MPEVQPLAVAGMVAGGQDHGCQSRVAAEPIVGSRETVPAEPKNPEGVEIATVLLTTFLLSRVSLCEIKEALKERIRR
jgi:hypothetical protein